MKTIFLALLILAVLPWPRAFANGGGYSSGGVTNSGDVLGFEPKAVENIRMVEENLTVKLGPNSAKVEVHYRMRNETGKKVKVRFGFPVEETGRAEIMWVPAGSEGPAPHRTLTYCQNYRVAAGGEALKASWQEEQRGRDDPRFRNLAGWFVSEMAFGKQEEKELRIAFDSVYPKNVRWVSDNGHTGAAIFKYRLSTAACWAGTIAKGRIVLEPDGIDSEELRVIKPVNRFRKEGRNWIWEFTDLEPTLDDDFEVEAQPETSSYFTEGEGDYVKRGERWTLAHANYEARASSALAPDGKHTYDAENLKQWHDAWAEGAPGPGIGEWIECKPTVPKSLVAISFDPGFSREDEQLYRANARPKKVRLELNGEHTVTMDVPDSPEEFRYAIKGYDKAVKTVRLTFEEVWPGDHFEDLCLRKLRLHVRLDRKPEIRPAR